MTPAERRTARLAEMQARFDRNQRDAERELSNLRSELDRLQSLAHHIETEL